jgi:hypothetical protein
MTKADCTMMALLCSMTDDFSRSPTYRVRGQTRQHAEHEAAEMFVSIRKSQPGDHHVNVLALDGASQWSVVVRVCPMGSAQIVACTSHK